jgi:hypothetical protein
MIFWPDCAYKFDFWCQLKWNYRPPPCVHDTEKLCITTQPVVGTVHRFRADSIYLRTYIARSHSFPSPRLILFPWITTMKMTLVARIASTMSPPFAIVDAPSCQVAEGSDLATPMDQSLVKDKLHNLISPDRSQETEKTAMGSSILYSPVSHSRSQTHTDFSDHPVSHDSGHLPDEFIDDDIEFDAAASLLAESPMLGRSSHFMTRSEPEKVQPRTPLTPWASPN